MHICAHLAPTSRPTFFSQAHEPSDIVHGLDQEMPGSGQLNNNTEKQLLKDGNLTMARLDVRTSTRALLVPTLTI